MQMQPVISTAIRSIGYDKMNQRLRIQFAQGHSYDFCRVPEHIYNGLMSAHSKGRYYDQYIRDRYHC